VDSEGWLHTGDLGAIDEEGRLFYHGRKKDIIVTADGLNVSPDDVEAVLARSPIIKDSAVVGIDDQVHAALILRNPNTAVEAIENAIRAANESLEDHQRIRRWSIWPTEDFPRTASTMKVKRKDVAEQIRSGPLQPKATPDPSAMSSLERVELLTDLEARHGIEIDEDAFSRAVTREDMKEFMSQPVEAPAVRGLSTWSMALPFRLLRGAFQRLVAVPLFRNQIPFQVDGAGILREIHSPVIFAANHASDLDTPAVFAALPPNWRKRVAPAMRADYFDKSWKLQFQYVLARLLFNAFPLPQEVAGTRRAFEFTAELLRKGFCPLIFPEGQRTRDGNLQAFRPGVGMMAVKLQVPVIPVRIEGMFEVYSVHDSWPKSSPVRVEFLPPLKFTPQTRYEDAANAIRDAIKL
jgi:long-chain acyl-CoA synthetase